MTFQQEILVPETPIKDSKLSRLIEVFGTSRPVSTLSRALENANGELELAIMYAAVEPIESINGQDLKDSKEDLMQPSAKKRKLTKKRNLIMSDEAEALDQSIQITEESCDLKASHDIITISSEKEEEALVSDASSDSIHDIQETTFEAATVLYFNSCACEQLMETTGCSQEDAEFITSQRPFDSFINLKESLGMHKKRFIAILDKYLEIMTGYAKVDQLIEQTRVFGEDIKTSLTKWGLSPDDSESGELSMIHLPKSNSHSSEKCSILEKQPDFIPSPLSLKSYQLIGVCWLTLLFEKGFSGILADEMGLGKTAQVISFLGHLLSKGIKGPHLIVAPSSTLENWAREVERWAPCLTFKVYYGSQSDRGFLQEDILEDLDNLNVVLTTYAMATGQKDDRSFLRKLGCISMILDEGHMIKNMESARYKYLSLYKVQFRLLMTGTPLQNNLMELLSLLTFIMPDLFGDEIQVLSKIFAVKPAKKTATSNNDNLLSNQRVMRAKEMMTPFVLRRRKDQVLKELPKKNISIVKCNATDHQQNVYDAIFSESKRNYLEAESVKNAKGASQTKVLNNYLMQLRKAANHPLLIRHHYTDEKLRKMAKDIMREPEYYDANQDYIFEDMQCMSDFELHQLCSKFKSVRSCKLSEEHWMDSGKVQELKKIIPVMADKGDRILIFSQFVIMLDVLEEVMNTLAISFLRLDGSTNVNERQGLIDEFNENPDISVFLISTKAGGVGINLTSANVVIIYDMDFNPHNDKQAEDRAHRVGQTKEVDVLKLVIGGSIEEHIYRSAETKIKLDEKIRGGQVETDDAEWLNETVMEAFRNELRG